MSFLISDNEFEGKFKNNFKILYKFASRSRPGKFYNGLVNIWQASHRMPLILASLDTDDIYSQGFKDSPVAHIFYGESKSKVDAINRDIEKAAGFHKEWDILVNFSDDMQFRVAGFDEVIREDMMKYFPDLDGVLHYNDGNHYGDKLMTMSIMGRKYYERFGYIYHPDYKSLWCDNEAMEVAKLLGKYQYIDRVLFNHNHPAWGKAEYDEQYKKTESFYEEDRLTYERRKANNFYL